MKLLNLKWFCILTGLFISVSMWSHWVELSKTVSTIDKLEIALHEIKKNIPLDSKISFLNNLKESSLRTELYYQTEFVVCPVVITQGMENDTVLLVEKTDKDLIKTDNMDTIIAVNKYDMCILLLKKK